MDAAVAELDLDRPAVDEVGLLLALVEVPAGLVAGRKHDRVDPEGGDAELAAHLAKAVALAERLERRDGVALAGVRRVTVPGLPLASAYCASARSTRRARGLFEVAVARLVVLFGVVVDEHADDPRKRAREPAISWAQSSGTALSPMRRAATAGNSASRSGSGSEDAAHHPLGDRSLRAMTSRISRSVASRTSSASLRSTEMAPRSANRRMAAGF